MFAAVDNVADAGDRDGSFGDIGGDDNLAGIFRRRGLEDAMLEGGSEGGEEWEREELRVWSVSLEEYLCRRRELTLGTPGPILLAYSVTSRSNVSTVSWPVKKTRMSPGNGSL